MQVLFTYKRIYDRPGFVLDRLWRKKKSILLVVADIQRLIREH